MVNTRMSWQRSLVWRALISAAATAALYLGSAAAISSVSIARLARAAGIRAEAFSGVSLRLCRISARSLALAEKNMSLISAASFGRIDRLEAIRSSASVGARAAGAMAGAAGIAGATGRIWSG